MENNNNKLKFRQDTNPYTHVTRDDITPQNIPTRENLDFENLKNISTGNTILDVMIANMLGKLATKIGDRFSEFMFPEVKKDDVSGSFKMPQVALDTDFFNDEKEVSKDVKKVFAKTSDNPKAALLDLLAKGLNKFGSERAAAFIADPPLASPKSTVQVCQTMLQLLGKGDARYDTHVAMLNKLLKMAMMALKSKDDESDVENDMDEIVADIPIKGEKNV